MSNKHGKYDFTWYDKAHMLVTDGIDIDVVEDLWCSRYGHHVEEDKITGDFFFEGATMRLLRAGRLLKRIEYGAFGASSHRVSFLVKE